MCNVVEKFIDTGRAEGKALMLKMLVRQGTITLTEASHSIDVTEDELRKLFDELPEE